MLYWIEFLSYCIKVGNHIDRIFWLLFSQKTPLNPQEISTCHVTLAVPVVFAVYIYSLLGSRFNYIETQPLTKYFFHPFFPFKALNIHTHRILPHTKTNNNQKNKIQKKKNAKQFVSAFRRWRMILVHQKWKGISANACCCGLWFLFVCSYSRFALRLVTLAIGLLFVCKKEKRKEEPDFLL